MTRKKPVKDPQAELDATCKLLCDEARNHMKVRNFVKALSVYNKVCISEKKNGNMDSKLLYYHKMDLI